MISFILFIIGFVFLIKGANLLVDGASSIAKTLKISDLVIGLTIVAFGTSAPELIINIFASVQGNADIVIGNILGSNIFNIFLILGISSIIFPLLVTKDTVWREIPFCLSISLLLVILANDNLIYGSNNSVISRLDGLVLIVIFFIFIFYIFRVVKRQRNEKKQDLDLEIKKYSFIKSFVLIIFGILGLNIGAKWVIDGAVEISLFFGVSQSLIALTIVALGTSLPELMTSTVAAFKKNTDIAIGNIVGSNIFNILLILGLSSLIRPLQINSSYIIDFLVGIIAPLFLLITMFTGRKKHLLERWEGVFFLISYIIYLIYLILRG